LGRIEGYRGIELLRRDGAAEVEFITIKRFDARSQHYDLRTARAAL